MDVLEALVAAELAEPVEPRVLALSEAIAERHPGARAVLFYGSCLRERALDGLMLDFYLIVADYRTAYDRRWLATANRLLPPNVFPIEAGGLAAKYAVLSQADFRRLCSRAADNVSVWARFAQPARLSWAYDDAARRDTVAAVSDASATLFALTLPTLEAGKEMVIADIWRAGFALTYAAELRAERRGRGGSIVDADPDRYERIGQAALARLAERRETGAGREGPNPVSPDAARRRWTRLQRRGKWLSVARLSKASATFAGGIDYLAWKINRHAGTTITLRPWQRRFPILGAISLLPRLIRSGAVR